MKSTALSVAHTQPERVGRPLHFDQQQHAGHGKHERGQIAPRAHAIERDADRADELHGGDQAHRQPGERQIERRVHDREAGAEGDQHQALPLPGTPEGAPGPGPGREDRRRRRDPEPGHPEDAHRREQQHRKGGPEIVEDGTDHEPGVGRRPAVAAGGARSGAGEGPIMAL